MRDKTKEERRFLNKEVGNEVHIGYGKTHAA